jgi:hypothetical protein
VYRAPWYYLFYSGDNCCGPRAHYAVMVARSRSATGPFETLAHATGRPQSLVLEGSERWRAPGHNSVLRDARGDDWIFYHAVDPRRPRESPTADVNTRRVFLADRLTYRDGWPAVDGGRPSHAPRAPAAAPAAPVTSALRVSELGLSAFPTFMRHALLRAVLALAALGAARPRRRSPPPPRAAADTVPLPEHPRPDFLRADWVNLNGRWQFASTARTGASWRAGTATPPPCRRPTGSSSRSRGRAGVGRPRQRRRRVVRAPGHRAAGWRRRRLPGGRRERLAHLRLARRAEARRPPGRLHPVRDGG